jgi:hypothetical protein
MRNLLKTIWGVIKLPFGLFKRRPKVIPPPARTDQEIANDKHRAKYRTELLNGVYFVQYYFNGEWWYLRLLDEDYILEEKRGQSIRMTDLQHLENVITKHQQWLSGGRFFLPFK